MTYATNLNPRFAASKHLHMDAQTQETPEVEAVRLCFRFKPRDIPGQPGARSLTVADAFMEVNFQRKFDWEKDHVYTPAGIDEVKDEGRRKFMFLDVNKHAHPTFLTLLCYDVAKGSPMYNIPSAAYMRANLSIGNSRRLSLTQYGTSRTCFHGAGVT